MRWCGGLSAASWSQPLASIVIVNRKVTTEGEYVGRPSPLGNPFALGAGVSRNEAIDAYADWLKYKIRERDAKVCGELERLRQKAVRDGKLVLACWCTPLRCHASVIADVLKKAIADGTNFRS